MDSSVSSVESMLLGFDTKLREMEKTLNNVMSDLTDTDEKFNDNQLEETSDSTEHVNNDQSRDFLYSEYSSLLIEKERLQQKSQSSKVEITKLKVEKDCALRAIEHLQQQLSQIIQGTEIIDSEEDPGLLKSPTNYSGDKLVSKAIIKDLRNINSSSMNEINNLKICLANLKMRLDEANKENVTVNATCDKVISENASARFLFEELASTLGSVIQGTWNNSQSLAKRFDITRLDTTLINESKSSFLYQIEETHDLLNQTISQRGGLFQTDNTLLRLKELENDQISSRKAITSLCGDVVTLNEALKTKNFEIETIKNEKVEMEKKMGVYRKQVMQALEKVKSLQKFSQFHNLVNQGNSENSASEITTQNVTGESRNDVSDDERSHERHTTYPPSSFYHPEEPEMRTDIVKRNAGPPNFPNEMIVYSMKSPQNINYSAVGDIGASNIGQDETFRANHMSKQKKADVFNFDTVLNPSWEHTIASRDNHDEIYSDNCEERDGVETMELKVEQTYPAGMNHVVTYDADVEKRDPDVCEKREGIDTMELTVEQTYPACMNNLVTYDADVEKKVEGNELDCNKNVEIIPVGQCNNDHQVNEENRVVLMEDKSNIKNLKNDEQKDNDNNAQFLAMVKSHKYTESGPICLSQHRNTSSQDSTIYESSSIEKCKRDDETTIINFTVNSFVLAPSDSENSDDLECYGNIMNEEALPGFANEFGDKSRYKKKYWEEKKRKSNKMLRRNKKGSVKKALGSFVRKFREH